MDAATILERLLVSTTEVDVAAATGISRGKLRRIRGGAKTRHEADVIAVLRACAGRRGVSLEPASPAAGRPPGTPPPAPAPAGPTAAKLAEADAVKRVAEARLLQLRVQDEARRQLLADRALIPTSEFHGVTNDIATELRRMADRMRRRVETVDPTAGGMIEEEWMATAPRIEKLLLRIDPAAVPAG